MYQISLDGKIASRHTEGERDRCVASTAPTTPRVMLIGTGVPTCGDGSALVGESIDTDSTTGTDVLSRVFSCEPTTQWDMFTRGNLPFILGPVCGRCILVWNNFTLLSGSLTARRWQRSISPSRLLQAICCPEACDVP